jgi:hypothetical protein
MSDLDEMWQELARYQPYADRRGLGDSWRRMCEERTEKAAADVASVQMKKAVVPGLAAGPVLASTWDASVCAACAAASSALKNDVKRAEWAAAEAAVWKERAIENVRNAIEQEELL